MGTNAARMVGGNEMTNKEVINFLNQVRKILLDDKSWLESTIQPINEAFDMAINALTVQPETHDKRTEMHACDCVRRQDAIDAMANTLWHYPNECYRNLNKYEFAKGLAELGLKSVPSAQPEPCEDADKLKRCRFEYINACKIVAHPTPDTRKKDIDDAYAVIKVLHPIFCDVEF